MTVRDLETLVDYGHWANTKLFQVISRVRPEQFTETVAGAYGSVRNTMVHLLSAEWGWIDRCGGKQRGQTLNPADYPTIASVAELCQRVEGYVREFLGTLRDEDLSRVVEFSLAGGPKQAMAVGELMHHAAIHAVHHRGQVALLLRSLGYVPGNFDILLYYSRHDVDGRSET